MMDRTICAVGNLAEGSDVRHEDPSSGARGRSGVSHVTLRSMDTETRFGRTHRRCRKRLMALRLSCRLRNVGAAPGPTDMTVATPLFPCLLWHGEDRHGKGPCHPPSGSLR